MAEARTITRRGLVLAAGAALGAAALPGAIVEALSAARAPTTAAGLAAFDPAAFVADLRAAGYTVTAIREVPRPDAGRPSYCIQPAVGRGFGDGYISVMERWADAMAACPDHVDHVVAHLARVAAVPA